MTRRRLLLFGLPTALVLLSLGGWLLIAGQARTIRPGMTLAEVEEIMGGPADGGGDGSKLYHLTWNRDDGPVTVAFDHGDRVYGPPTESILDRLRRWLGARLPVDLLQTAATHCRPPMRGKAARGQSTGQNQRL